MSKFIDILDIFFEDKKKDSQKIKKIVKSQRNTSVSKTLDAAFYSMSSDAPTYKTATELAKHFDITASELNNIFSQLKWATKEQKWWLVTKLGTKQGGKQSYNARSKIKYILWEVQIKSNQELISTVNAFKATKRVMKKVETTKEKGTKYEAFVAEYYRKKGYVVWEHGKEKGKLDQGIDLIVKKKKEILFIQCKNWKENSRFKIDHKELKASRTEAREFMKKNPLFKNYQIKFRYTLSSNCMHLSALMYMQENKELFDYEVIGMK